MLKNNKLRGNSDIKAKLQAAEKLYDSLPEVDWNNVDRDLLKQKTEAYNEVHKLRRLYFDRH